MFVRPRFFYGLLRLARSLTAVGVVVSATVATGCVAHRGYQPVGTGRVTAGDVAASAAPGAGNLSPAVVVHGVGTGFGAESSALVTRLGDALRGFDASALPHAADLARLAAAAYRRGDAISPDALEPAYLRDKVALTLAEQGKPKPAL